MKLNDQFIATVQDANDIVDVVGEYVRLKKKGNNYWGLCPFHNEKTPSFSVSATKGIYKCFGCGKGGSVFNFIMDIENLSFPESVRLLAQKANIEIPRATDDSQFSKEDALVQINKWAADWFHKNLYIPEGKFALDYCHQRGLTEESILKFQLGFAPDEWDGLKSAAYRDRLKMDFVDEVGLLIRKDTGDYYDRFRNRVMFPVINHTGRVVAFGGRALDDKADTAKYINSPETALYHKSNVLYGLYQAKDEIRKRAEIIVVEGYMDVISLWQHGIRNVVATSGTALTHEQVKLIKRYTDQNLLFLYDGDEAGQNAMERAIEVLFANELLPQLVILPDGHDPDSYVKEFGADGFRKFVEVNKKSFVEFVLTREKHKTGGDLQTNVSAMKRIVSLVARYPGDVGREAIIQQVAKMTRISESALLNEVNRVLKQDQKWPARKASVFPSAQSDPVQPDKPMSSAERDLLKIILEEGKEYADYIRFYIDSDHFSNKLARSVYEKLVTFYSEGGQNPLSTLINDLPEAQKQVLLDLSMDKESISDKWMGYGFDKSMMDKEQWVHDSIVSLRLEQVNLQLKVIQKSLGLVDIEGPDMEIILENQRRLLEEKKRLTSHQIFRDE